MKMKAKAALSLAMVGTLHCLGNANEIDNLISRLGTRNEGNSYSELHNFGKEADEKLILRLKDLRDGRVKANARQVETIVSLLGYRLSRGNAPHHLEPTFEVVEILFDIPFEFLFPSSRYLRIWGGRYYHFLVKAAKESTGIKKKRALGVLRITAHYGSSYAKLGDPTLIRLFRKEKDWGTLSILRDYDSIPQIRMLLDSMDEWDKHIGIIALARLNDVKSIPKMIPSLSKPSQLKELQVEGKFGEYHWALLTMSCHDYVPILIAELKKRGPERASLLNLVGYFGKESDIPALEPFLSDRELRPRQAAFNAIQRLKGIHPNQPK